MVHNIGLYLIIYVYSVLWDVEQPVKSVLASGYWDNTVGIVKEVDSTRVFAWWNKQAFTGTLLGSRHRRTEKDRRKAIAFVGRMAEESGKTLGKISRRWKKAWNTSLKWRLAEKISCFISFISHITAWDLSRDAECVKIPDTVDVFSIKTPVMGIFQPATFDCRRVFHTVP